MAEQKAQHMPIFSKSYDMLIWLMQVTQHFPRAHRHDYTKRLLDAAFDFRECLEVSNLRRAGARLEYLHKADEALAKLKLYVRLAVKMGWLSRGQYEHIAKMEVEVGKLLGGWMKVT